MDDRPGADFFAAVRAASIVSGEEEVELVRRWREAGDVKARDRLVEAHLRLVVKTATQFRGYGLSVSDLVAEGNLGLMKALDGFDPSRDLRFSTYAQWWIRAAMFEHVLRFSTPVTFGLSAERKRLFFKLRGIKARLRGPEGGSLSPAEVEEVARALGSKEERVREMEGLLTQSVRSLDAPVLGDGTPFGELLADGAPSVEEALGDRQELMYRREALKEVWGKLSEREQVIVAERALQEKPSRLEDLAQRYGISRERVRQIEAAAMDKLKALVLSPKLKLLNAAFVVPM
jgi:RNA polymerase sigma-32 factor